MQTIDEYLEQISGSQLGKYESIRKLIQKYVPDAVEMLNYGVLTFKYKNKVILHFGAFKNHMSLFPASDLIETEFGGDIEKFQVSKGTLQFTEDNPISDELIEKIIVFRKAAIDNK